MSPFDILLVGHLIGDYLFQTSWMAANKAKRWGPLLAHVFVYTSTVYAISFGFGGLSIPGILLIFVSHLLLDRRTFVEWWVTRIMRAPDGESRWLMIVVDQIFHIIFLALALTV